MHCIDIPRITFYSINSDFPFMFVALARMSAVNFKKIDIFQVCA